MRDDVTNFLVKWKRGLVVNASRGLFTIKEKYSVIVVYSSPFFAMPHWCIAYRLDFRRSLVSGPRAFGWGARAPFPNSGWWSSLYCLRLYKFFRHGSQKVLQASLTTAKQVELLSKWRSKKQRTNTPVNEHSRICFTKKPGSSRANLKPEFCFVEEKEPRKSPKNRKPVEKQQKISDGSGRCWICRRWYRK